MTDDSVGDSGSSIDNRHLLLVGAGPGLGTAVARRFAEGVEHLQTAYAVDVISAIVVTPVAAPAKRAAGSGTIIVTGGGFADHPIPALATVPSARQRSGPPPRCSEPTWRRTASAWRH